MTFSSILSGIRPNCKRGIFTGTRPGAVCSFIYGFGLMSLIGSIPHACTAERLSDAIYSAFQDCRISTVERYPI